MVLLSPDCGADPHSIKDGVSHEGLANFVRQNQRLFERGQGFVGTEALRASNIMPSGTCKDSARSNGGLSPLSNCGVISTIACPICEMASSKIGRPMAALLSAKPH
jgi:hypothetical protein